ncbi:MAG: hypothetical protein WBF36_04455, partial [Desulfobulbales bacterium]
LHRGESVPYNHPLSYYKLCNLAWFCWPQSTIFFETHPLLGLRSFAGNEFNEHAPLKKISLFQKDFGILPSGVNMD